MQLMLITFQFWWWSFRCRFHWISATILRSADDSRALATTSILRFRISRIFCLFVCRRRRRPLSTPSEWRHWRRRRRHLSFWRHLRDRWRRWMRPDILWLFNCHDYSLNWLLFMKLCIWIISCNELLILIR